MAQDTIDKIITITFKSSDLVKQWEELTAEIEKTKTATKNLNKEDADYYKQVAKNKAQLRELGRQQKQVQKELDNNIKLEKTGKGSLTQMRAAVKSLTAEYESLSAAERKGSRGTEILKNIQSTTSEINKQEAAMRNYRSNVDNYAGGIQKAFAKIGAAWLAVKAAYSFFSSAIKTIKDFEQANTNLGTILGASKKEMDALRESALELGRTTEYTASQVTMLQTELAKLGFGPQSIQAMQEPILHFATAVGAQLPEAAKLAGAALRIFGLNANQTEDTLDVLAASTNKSALSFEYLNNALSTVGPVAKTFGFSIRDTTALLASLANSGFEASTAATATRNILLNLADTNGKLAKSLGGPVKTIPELVEGLKKLRAQGIDLAGTLELTDKRSVAAFNTFLNGADSVQELRDAFEDVGGTAKNIAEERLNTVEGSIKLMQSAWEGFVLSFYNSKGTLKTVIDWLTAALTGVTDIMLGEDGRRLRDERTIVSSITETVNKQFTQAFSETSGEDLEKRIEEATARVQDKLKKEMDEIWGGVVDPNLIKKSIGDALTTSANAIRESEVAAIKSAKTLSEKELKAQNKAAKELIAIEDKLRTTILSMRQDTMEKEIELSNQRYVKEREQLEHKLRTDKNLTLKAKGVINHLLIVLEEKRLKEESEIRAKWSEKEFEEEVRNEQNRIKMRFNAQNKLQSLSVKQSQVENFDALNTADPNRLLEKNAAQFKLAQEQQAVAENKLAEIQSMSEETYEVLYGGVLEWREAELDAQLAVAKAKQHTNDVQLQGIQLQEQETQMALQSAQQMIGALGDMAEAAGASAEVSAMLAIAESAAAMGIALSKAFSSSATIWDGIAGAVAAISTITTIITQIKSLNSSASSEASKYSFADGGLITGPGTGTSDSITARVSNGEAVMTAAAVADWGAVLSAINVSSGGNAIDTSHLPSRSGGGMEQMEEMMERVMLKMPSPVVSVVDINRGQNRVKVSANLGRLGRSR